MGSEMCIRDSLARAQRGRFRLFSQHGAQNGPRSPCYAYCRSRGGCRPSTTAEVCVLHVVQEKSGVGAWRLEVALWRRPFRAAILVARGGQFSGPGARYTSLQGLNEAFWWCFERITVRCIQPLPSYVHLRAKCTSGAAVPPARDPTTIHGRSPPRFMVRFVPRSNNCQPETTSVDRYCNCLLYTSPSPRDS